MDVEIDVNDVIQALRSQISQQSIDLAYRDAMIRKLQAQLADVPDDDSSD